MDAHVESEIVLGLDLQMLSDLCYHGSMPLLKMRYMSSEQRTNLVLGFSFKGQCLWKPPQSQVPMRAVIGR
ncbi:unnamed protein product [Sphagnum balticum]